jgi:8-oxo-dGTP pyrophosphatase MutT (NUDIX family)
MRQVAAFPYRRSEGANGSIELLLVTSGSGRWIIPKGDIDHGMAPHRAAEKEAFEEGGVRGKIGEIPIGTFCHRKKQNGAAILTEVEVFALHVQEELPRWPEDDRRDRRWLALADAAREVKEPGLEAIISSFEPD